MTARSASSDPRPAGGWLNTAAEWAVLAAVVVAVSAFLIHEICSLDVWWQVAIGEDVLQSQEIPRLGRYAAAGLNAPYHDSHWLFQIVLALSHRAAGMVGVELVMIVLWTLTLIFCYRAARRWVGMAPGALLVFLAAMAAVERFLPRPELVTFLMIALFYLRLQERRFRSLGELALLAGLQMVWVNSHGLFVVGPFLVGCGWVLALGDRLRRRPNELAAWSRALAVVIAATLVSPFGLGGWRYALRLFTQIGGDAPEVFRTLGELSPTFGAAARSAPAFWFFLVLGLGAGGLGVAALIRRRELTPRHLQLAGLLLAALSGRRNVVVFALAAAPFAAEALAVLGPRFRRLRPASALPAAALLLAWSWYPLSGAYYVRIEIPARWGFGVTPSFFPHRLPAFLEATGFEGQVLNSNSLGGFYLYHGYPRRIPLTDGRWEAYDQEVLAEVLSASRHAGRWRRLISRYRIRGILLAHTSPEARAILPELARDPGWRLTYLDLAASFWQPAGPEAPPAVDLSDPARLPVPPRIDDGIIFDAFLAAAGTGPQRLVHLERTLAFNQRTEYLLAELGRLQIRLGRKEEAEKTLRELLRREPDNLTALNELAFLAYARGDLATAEALLRRALVIVPDDVKLQENLRRLRAARVPG